MIATMNAAPPRSLGFSSITLFSNSLPQIAGILDHCWIAPLFEHTKYNWSVRILPLFAAVELAGDSGIGMPY